MGTNFYVLSLVMLRLIRTAQAQYIPWYSPLDIEAAYPSISTYINGTFTDTAAQATKLDRCVRILQYFTDRQTEPSVTGIKKAF